MTASRKLIGESADYQSTVTLVILSLFPTCPILASPTTEPGRRGWRRRLGSPISAPHFFARTLPTASSAQTTLAFRFPLCTSVLPVVEALLLDRDEPASTRLTLATPGYPPLPTPHRIES